MGDLISMVHQVEAGTTECEKGRRERRRRRRRKRRRPKMKKKKKRLFERN